MLNLPRPVLDYIYSLSVENRSAAYLLIEKDGGLSDWGGELKVYGITNLQKGEASSNLFCLINLFTLLVKICCYIIEVQQNSYKPFMRINGVDYAFCLLVYNAL